MWEKWLRYRNAQKLKDERYRFLFDAPPLDEVVVFDTETTGLNPKKDEILSIGAVIVKENKILTSQKFELFVKPSREINEASIKIHQIRNIDLENGGHTIQIKDDGEGMDASMLEEALGVGVPLKPQRQGPGRGVAWANSGKPVPFPALA